MPPLPNRSGEQIKEERASKASIGSHVTLIADFINAIGHKRKTSDRAEDFRFAPESRRAAAAPADPLGGHEQKSSAAQAIA
jgi:hypothetical protein